MFGTVNSSNSIFVSTLFGLTLLFFCSCSNDKAKSECYYERVDTMMEIIELKPHPEGNGRIAVVLDFKGSKLAFENQELGDLKDISIDHDFLVRNNIEIGNKYEVSVSELTKGDCIPRFISFNTNFE